MLLVLHREAEVTSVTKAFPFKRSLHVAYGERIQSRHAMSRYRATCSASPVLGHLAQGPLKNMSQTESQPRLRITYTVVVRIIVTLGKYDQRRL